MALPYLSVPLGAGLKPSEVSVQLSGATGIDDDAPAAGVAAKVWPLAPWLLAEEPVLRTRLLEAGFHRTLVETVVYWRGLHRRGLPPARADIDPAEIRGLLPSLALLDDATLDGAPRYRLAGTAVVELFGTEPTGRPVETLGGPLTDFVLACWADLAAAPPELAPELAPDTRPVGKVCSYRDDDRVQGGLYQYECAFLPLSDCFVSGARSGNARVLLCLLRRFISDTMPMPSARRLASLRLKSEPG